MVLAFTGVSILFFAASCYYSYVALQRERHAQAEQEARRALVSYEADAIRMFDYADSYLRSIRRFYMEYGTDVRLSRVIEDIRAPHSESFSGIVSILDRQGRIIFRSDKTAEQLAQYPEMAATDHFAYWRTHHDDTLYIGSTRRGKVSGTLDFRIARRVDRDGVFDGEIVLTLLPDQLLRLYGDLRLGPHGSTAMWTLEPKLIARRSQLSSEQERYEELMPSVTKYIEQGHGTARFASSLDGITRYLSFARLADYPLFIAVGLSEDDVEASLAGARDRLLLLAGTFTVFASLVCGLVLRQIRQNHDLLATSRQLERSNADLEQFAYLASHDLQTPLRNVTSFVQLLERRYKGRLDAEGDEFIAFIVDGAKRMHDLINALLSYAQMNRQDQKLSLISARRAFDSALANLQTSIAEIGAEITVGHLPEVLANEEQLVSLFQNLIGNALKYRHPDRPLKVNVQVTPHAPDQWRFSVSDNGIGIEKEYFGKIFQIFQRLSADPGIDGTGIGLAICKRILDHSGGAIWVESEPGAGTTFLFTLHEGSASTA